MSHSRNTPSPRSQREGVAIIGMGCRFPGGINDCEAFWKMLTEGREGVCDVPADRWNVERFYDPEPGIQGKSITKRGGFVDGIDQFDPQFFGISPREAAHIDPQQRLLLETAWEAIEDAGLVLDFEKGTDIGVFAGISHNDYQAIQHAPTDRTGISAHTPTGSAHSIAANRISYCLNLSGPSIAVDTACSSALTAVHLACEHILTDRCRTALAGGVTVMIAPDGFIGFSQAGMLSPEGKCKAFDAAANGFVRGEGAGMVLLKRLSEALADGDPIHPVILGSAVNQDGHTNGISLPSPEAQARLVQDACMAAGVSPSEVGFVEAHGTGTAVGDPIEAHALAQALCGDRPADEPLLIGSVKTNLGHLETASGIAGLIKAALALKHQKIPASLHFTTPNPHIDFDDLKLRLPVELEPFPLHGTRRLAGVNSFGFGGANAHVVLTEPPRPQSQRVDGVTETDRAWPILLSARSEASLKTSAKHLGTWIEQHANRNGSTPLLPDLTYMLGARRNHHPHRLALAARSRTDLARELAAFARGETPAGIRAAFSPRCEKPARIGFVLSGQGTQAPGMGRELLLHEPIFRKTVEACEEAMRPWAKFSLLEEIAKPEGDSQMQQTGISQPAIFAIQMGLAALWKSWGVVPSAIVGHSVGEVAAACVAGILTLEQAAQVIVLRGQCMDNHTPEGCGMLAVGMTPDEAATVIARHDRTVSIAAFNGPQSLTLAGKKSSLETIAAELEGEEIFARFLKVSHPFHHEMMQPAADALCEALEGLCPSSETLPFFSTVTGTRLGGEACDADHWARGVRLPVQFAAAVGCVAEQGIDIWLEVGAHPALVRSLQECLAGQATKPVILASMRREREQESLVETAVELHLSGVELDFKTISPSRNFLNLPSYPWDKNRWWNECAETREGRLAPGGRGLLDVRLSRANPTWIARLDSRHMAFLKDHQVEDLTIFPAAGFVEMALEAGTQLFEGAGFVVEDFEIRKPLILPDTVSGLLLELTWEPGQQTFSIQSRFPGSTSWSVHVVGSMRSERTESAFAETDWEHTKPPGLSPGSPSDFYERAWDLGLHYGEEFRPIREVSAGSGASSGRVELSEHVAQRASEYQLHPVLFDGALQIFSAGKATVEGRTSGLRLPVRFARIHFLQSPGATGLVSARVTQANEELVEGDIAIYDASGKPCASIQGFRAISVEGGRRAGRTGKGRDLTYHVAWEKQPHPIRKSAPEPLPLSQLKQAAQHALHSVLSLRGKEHLEAANAAIEKLSFSQVASGFCALLAGQTEPFTADSLGVAAPMRPAFQQLVQSLTKEQLLVSGSAGYQATPALTAAADALPELLRTVITRHPGHLPDALLCQATTSELGPILRGERDAVQVLFSSAMMDVLDQFYGDSPATSPWLAAIGAAVVEAAGNLPEGRGLRILEVGAGTGGLASQVLPLLERGLHSYIFSDVSASFFPAARQKLAAFSEVDFQVLDLENPGANLELASFDLILGTNVLHAVSDVQGALKNLHNLLTPGGSLLFVDVGSPHLWLDAVFGLTSGWWKFTDRTLRPKHPLLTRAQWETVLGRSGFSEATSLPGLVRSNGDESLIGLLARKAWKPAAEASIPEDTRPTENSWLILADAAGLGEQLATSLRATGARCRLAYPGTEFTSREKDVFTLRPGNAEDWTQLLKTCAKEPPERLTFLWPLDTVGVVPHGKAPWTLTDSLLHLIHALDAVLPGKKLRLDLITRGAQAVGRRHGVSVAQAPALGFLRVVANEYPNLTCRSIDLPPAASSDDGDLLKSELRISDSEREVVFRGEARHVRRIARGLPPTEQLLDPSVPLRLESRERGLLDSLKLVPFVPTACGPDEVEIEVCAAGMNFRDVLKALALYPAETADARIFGDEVAGVVKSVGDRVTHVAPGDRVFGLAVFGLATRTLARGADIHALPAGLSFEEAATFPVVFMTAWHALKTVAQLQPGETILIHAGAGGVGMAATQIAHHLGAEVIATAGSPSKRTLLNTLGVRHVVDSRRADFADAVREITGGRGVDVVLNSLAAEAIPMGLSCLAEFGRFIEIGKRDIYQNSRIPLWPMRHNASFHVVAMDAIFGGNENLTAKLLGGIADLVEAGALHPLPFRAFPACRIDAAFRLMAQGKHTGKVIVTFAPTVSRPMGRAGHAGVPGGPRRMLSHYRCLWGIRQGGGGMAGRVRRKASGSFQPERSVHPGKRSVSCLPPRQERHRPGDSGRRRIARRSRCAPRGNCPGGLSAQGNFPSGHGD